LHHAPHPPHDPDDLEGEGGVPLIPRHENPPLLPPGFPEVHPIRGRHEVDTAVLDRRVLLHDQLFPWPDGPGPAIIHRTTQDLIQRCASHEARVAQEKRVVKGKNSYVSPPWSPRFMSELMPMFEKAIFRELAPARCPGPRGPGCPAGETAGRWPPLRPLEGPGRWGVGIFYRPLFTPHLLGPLRGDWGFCRPGGRKRPLACAAPRETPRRIGSGLS
jgi:hypothetical protein